MIGLLRGQAFDSEPAGTVIVDVGGVGYELVAPLGTLGRAVRDADGCVTLHVHTHVREEAFELYGFATGDERTAFRTLITISKVGPKLALAVLGAVSVGDLAQLIESGQTAQLTQVPGIGKKTAERIALELKGKLGSMAGGPALQPGRPSGPASGQTQVLHEALVRMGFKQGEAERATSSLSDLDRPMGELLREALTTLSR